MTATSSPTPERPLDRLVAAVALLASLPVLALAAVGIKLSSPGPVIYRAQRAGLGGRPFTMFKLRTMRLAGDSQVAGRITGGGDSRVFAWGQLLRRFKLDELPQLVNVARGEMAIVGPRPEDPSIVERDYADWMHETLTVLPGLTSPGSLSYYAEEALLPATPAEAELVYLRELLPRKLATDLVYVRNRTRAYDLRLVLRTLAGLVGAHGAFGAEQARERAGCERILAEVGRG